MAQIFDAQMFDIEGRLNRLLENPYQRPNVGDAQTFLTKFANDDKLSHEARQYFTENPNGLDEISRYLKTDKALKSRIAEKRTLSIHYDNKYISATILDIIRLHRSFYGPFETSHTYISMLRSGTDRSYLHSIEYTKHKLINYINDYVHTDRRTPLNSTPFADLYDLFDAYSQEMKLQCLMTLAQQGHIFALAALVEIYKFGIVNAMGETIVDPNLDHAAQLAEQLKQFEQSPAAFHARADFVFEQYRAAMNQGDHSKADDLKKEYKKLFMEAANLGHIDAKNILALEKLLGHEILPGSLTEEQIIHEINELASLPDTDELTEILELLCEKSPIKNNFRDMVLTRLSRIEALPCSTILIGIVLNQDHYRATDGFISGLGNRKARELIRYISSLQNPYNLLLTVIDNPYVSMERKESLFLREIDNDMTKDASNTIDALMSIARVRPKFTLSLMRSLLLEKGYTKQYFQLYNLFGLDSPGEIQDRSTAIIGSDHYQFLFNTTLTSRAIAAGKHESDYSTKTIAGRTVYVETYESLSFLRNKIKESIPRIMTGEVDEQEKEDIQRFCRIIDEQAENALIYPEMNRLEAKQKAKERLKALQSKK